MYVYQQFLQQNANINWMLLRTAQKRMRVKNAKDLTEVLLTENLKRTWDFKLTGFD